MQINEEKSQAGRFSDILIGLKENVSPEDRSLAVSQLGLSTATISKYLKGEVMNLDTAVSLITFFKNRIALREKVITQ